MTLSAVAFPILPDRIAEWHTFIQELNGERHDEFVASRERAGVQERTFLQHTPMGDLVIVTLEGENPLQSFGQMANDTDAFHTWFRQRVQAIHGVDLTAPMTGAPSELVVDSSRTPVLAK